ncbi:MAG TPA: hypothetical protein PK048_03505 [Candidatus Absconditabacterales bacterium]|nr:hypothetical protein [Candidatus Absconditabacterales bacterium]
MEKETKKEGMCGCCPQGCNCGDCAGCCKDGSCNQGACANTCSTGGCKRGACHWFWCLAKIIIGILALLALLKFVFGRSHMGWNKGGCGCGMGGKGACPMMMDDKKGGMKMDMMDKMMKDTDDKKDADDTKQVDTTTVSGTVQ